MLFQVKWDGMSGLDPEIYETTFLYGDSGPMAREEPYEFQIDEIDTDTFAYWDDEVNQWTNYYVADAIENRKRTLNR